jgi:uncharacterized protein
LTPPRARAEVFGRFAREEETAMPDFPKAVPGNFCWTEAQLEDPDRGKAFYGELFGWSVQSVPSPMGPYHMMKLGEKLVAGIGKLPPNAKQMGAPPHWLNHVAVEDAAAASAKAKSLGAKILLEPHDVGPGLMVVVQDPTGGVLAMWAPKQSMGTFVWDEPNSLCWNELITTDVVAATKFYVGLFGWKTEAMPMGDFTYTIAKNRDLAIAGLMQQPESMAGMPSLWGTYFAVADCDATVKRAEQLGATVMMPPTDIPEVGRFATLSDPQGAVFSLIKAFR